MRKNKTQLSDVLSEFVIFLKLGVLWWKWNFFIANFSHVSPNRFWRIFSMLLHSHLTIKRRSVAISLTLNHNLTGLPALFTDSPPFPPREWRQTRVSCKRNGIPVCYRNKQRNFTTNQVSCSRNTRRRWQISVCKF